MNHASVNVDWMKAYVIQTKNEIITNVCVSAKNKIIGILVKMIIRGILAHVIVNVIKHAKLMNV